ncbi:MAG TPA: hypothetical protein VGQ26_08300 [Streptosporangiaceae bacterium]|jgi:hypothetical protein|nr:hypothetical protein [Streptosporangiaceae bacterium]
MSHSITSLPRARLATRAAARVARWQRRISGRMQAEDTLARQAGWTITRTRFGGRIYRDPRFDQLAASRAPGTSHQVARLPSGRPPPTAEPSPIPGTSGLPAARPARRNRNGGPDDRQHR